MAANVVILGGGIGGIVAAREVVRRVGKKASVLLIERKPRFVFPPSLPWVAMGSRAPGQIQREMTRLERSGVDLLLSEVTSLDLRERTVRTATTSVRYDQLVIALGAEYAPELIPGFAERAHHMYDLGAAVKMRSAVETFVGGTVVVGVARTPFKCPAAPYEIALLLDDAFRRRGIRKKIRIEFFTPEPAPLPAAGPNNGGKVLSLLHDREILYHPKRKLKEVGTDRISFEEGESLPFDLLICVPPHRAPKPVIDAGLTDSSGFIPVDPATLETRQPNVYAVGDVATIPTPHGFVPLLPKAGVFAQGHAAVVAHNLAVRILGKGRLATWDGYGACFLEVARRKSAFIRGHFLAAPHPELDFRPPGAIHHAQKVLLERYWLRHWF